jgi:hypothetical protein
VSQPKFEPGTSATDSANLFRGAANRMKVTKDKTFSTDHTTPECFYVNPATIYNNNNEERKVVPVLN